MQRRILILFFLLVSSSSAYAGEIADKIAYLAQLRDEGRALVFAYTATPSDYPYLDQSMVDEIWSIVTQAGALVMSFQYIYGNMEQPGNPSYDNWVTNSVLPFFVPGGSVERYQTLVTPPSIPLGDVVIPVSIPDLDYVGVVMSILGYLTGIAALAVGLGLSVWGVPFLFRFFKRMAR